MKIIVITHRGSLEGVYMDTDELVELILYDDSFHLLSRTSPKPLKEIPHEDLEIIEKTLAGEWAGAHLTYDERKEP